MNGVPTEGNDLFRPLRGHLPLKGKARNEAAGFPAMKYRVRFWWKVALQSNKSRRDLNQNCTLYSAICTLNYTCSE